MRRVAICCVVLAFLGNAHAGDLLRCGKWVVDSTVSLDEFVAKCGEPTSKKMVEEDVRGPNVYGVNVKKGTTITEYWTYDRGPRGIAMLVTITDGKIRSIDRAE